MSRKIEFELAEIGIKFYASMLFEEEPELCYALWKYLEQSVRLFCRHPVSTGEVFFAESRPPKHPVKTGTQAQPLGRKKWLFTRIPPGSVVYSVFGGYGGISLVYGPCTEPLPPGGSVVAEVNDDDMYKLIRAGRTVWTAQYFTHSPMMMIARREE
jgi:hypothetical protein